MYRSEILVKSELEQYIISLCERNGEMISISRHTRTFECRIIERKSGVLVINVGCAVRQRRA